MTGAGKVVKCPQTAKWYDSSSINHTPVCWHSLSPPHRPPPLLCRLPPSPRTLLHLLGLKYSDGEDNSPKSPNQQLNLTPALAPLRRSRPAVGKQSQTSEADAIKKRFNFRHTDVQFCHTCESDNHSRSTEILQINQ